MKRRVALTVLAAITTAGVAGCYQSPDVSMHEPGVYKGGRDPLQALEKKPEQQKKLQERFNLVQVDR
ncbi:MAG: hypothetical protein P8076_03390 [Gammaproteobacteria bacterium]